VLLEDSSLCCGVASLALGFASFLSILNRDSPYSREIVESLLCLDRSSEDGSTSSV